MSNPLEDWLDETIPDEVLNDELCQPRLLPDLDKLPNFSTGYSDLIEWVDYGDDDDE
jgi:hypothetical protein